MNRFGFIKSISLLVAAVYFVSCIAGPAFGFSLKSPSKVGEYQAAFDGRDIDSEGFSSAGPVTVLDNKDTYEAEKAAKIYTREGNVSTWKSKAIIFPKGFKSEDKWPSYLSMIGAAAGLAILINNDKKNMLLWITAYCLIATWTVVTVWGLPDYLMYASTDIGWIKVKNNLLQPELIKYRNIVYFSSSHDIYSSPNNGVIIGKINRGVFRRILNSKEISGSTWYKVKIEDTPLFN